MSARLTFALTFLALVGCANAANDPALMAAATREANQDAAAKGEPPVTSSCRAQSGIWTLHAQPASAATTINCTAPSVSSGTYGNAGTSVWNYSTITSECSVSVVTDPDGCAQICTNSLANGTLETTLTIASATSITGSAVMTLTDGTRCEYDITMAKN